MADETDRAGRNAGLDTIHHRGLEQMKLSMVIFGVSCRIPCRGEPRVCLSGGHLNCRGIGAGSSSAAAALCQAAAELGNGVNGGAETRPSPFR
jgi:hypothetical protein